MKRAPYLLLFSVLAGVALVWLLRGHRQAAPESTGRGPLVVYCAAGLKTPVEATARAYEQAYGVRVQLQYGGSGTLLSSLRVAARGDLYVAGDESYLRIGQSNHLVAETIPLAEMTPVIAVRRGNPKQVHSIDDLMRVEVALANPDATAIGQITRELLTRRGGWIELEKRVRVFKPTVNDVANDIKLGTVDAGIVWDATVRQYPELEMVTTEALEAGRERIGVGVLTSCVQPAAALHFARYLGAPEKGLAEFVRAGYRPVPGDRWMDTPEVVLFSGGVNRLAIEPTLQRFEKREGARVTRIYNGCGILVAQMKAGQRPDAYFACDVSFMREVTNFFSDPLDLSQTAMVLLLPKGNPKSIRTLADLARPGLRVGLAHEEQSALGALTARLLRAQDLYDQVRTNVRVETPTADLLVNQMRAGSLDAAVVYEANVSQVKDQLAVVRLSEKEATAVQPFAIGRNSEHRRLMERLLHTLRAAESREQFESIGFHWCARGD